MINSRRHFFKKLSIAASCLMAGTLKPLIANQRNTVNSQYKIAVCDWMILKRQKLGAFSLAAEIGADGIQLDMGGLGQRDTFDNKLLDPHMAKQFLEEGQKHGVEISSLAMSGFYGQSFAERTTVPKMVDDCLETMDLMGVGIAFLPLGVNDLLTNPEIRPAVVERLKMAGEKAEKKNKVIAIETSLPANHEVSLLEEIGSPNVKISFNFANAIKYKRSIADELKCLGKENIAQIHASDTDGVLLENNPNLDMKTIKEVLDKMDWSGWLIIERSRDVKDVHNVKRNYGKNASYLKSVFQQYT